MTDENTEHIIDHGLLPVTPITELPANSRVLYRTEFDAMGENILIVEIIWKLDREGKITESILDRRVLGREDDKEIAKHITAYLNAHHA